ncbi:MAG: HAD family phosphatase [Pseudomonadota bacterium]
MNRNELKLNTRTPQAVVLDLGNVVLGVDFGRVMRAWAEASAKDPQHFHQRWDMNEPYRQHERGQLSFAAYADHLGELFEVNLSLAEWQRGWNDIWTGAYTQVIALLPEVARQYPLYCFTNTNDTHTAYWRHHYAEALSHFRHIFVSSQMGQRKPDIDAFHTVCKDIGHAPQDVLFIDDSADNIRGAEAAGLNAVLVGDEAAVVNTLRRLL